MDARVYDYVSISALKKRRHYAGRTRRARDMFLVGARADNFRVPYLKKTIQQAKLVSLASKHLRLGRKAESQKNVKT